MWGWVKRVARAAVSVIKQVGAIVNEVVNRAAAVIDFAMTLAGLMLPRKLRLLVFILRDENGVTVLGQGSNDDVIPSPVPYISPEDEAKPIIDAAMKIFADAMNIRIVPAIGSTIARVHGAHAPTEALDPHCNCDAWVDDTGVAGSFYRSASAAPFAGAPIGYFTPITAFVVRDVHGKQGCSLGSLTDYVTVDAEGARYPTATILAHELGHACGLFHRDAGTNLMHGGKDRGTDLTRWQKAVIRSSKHVSYL